MIDATRVRWRIGRWLGPSLLGLAGVVAAGRASQDAQDHGMPGKPPADRLARVAVVGASVSDGFALQSDMARVLDEAITSTHRPPVNHSDSMLFFEPGAKGMAQLDAVGQAQPPPTLVVGIDFLFWFGYGDVDIDGRAMRTREQRVANVDRVLKRLEGLGVPVAVGDFPDMSPAVGLMLRQSQVPDPDTLQALNERLRDWAQGRDDILILPLAQSVLDVRSDAAFAIGDDRWPAGQASKLLQLDRLHPTLPGMVALGAVCTHGLVVAEWAQPSAFLSAADVLVKLQPAPRPAGVGSGAGDD